MLRWNRKLVLIIALIVVGLLTANFAIRSFGHAQRLRARADEPIQGWMNVPYIARSYRVPPDIVASAIGLTPQQRDRRPLWQIAQEQGRSPDTLIAAIKTAIERDRAAHPPPGQGPRPSAAPGSQP